MTLEGVIESLTGLKARLTEHVRLLYLKLEVASPASMDAIDALEAALPFELDPAMQALWTVSESVKFEWFIKSEGIRTAGLDSRLAPCGQFTMLSPQEAQQEYAFLSELSMDGGESMPFVPFARMQPNGELLAIDHSDEGAVVLVVLDLALTVYPLKPSLAEWFEQRMATYFADDTIDPSVKPSPQLSSIITAFNAPEVNWPPKQVGW